MSTNDASSRRAALLWLRLRWDRAAEAVFLAGAAVVLVVTYRSVSRTPFVADQLAYLASGGVAGLVLLAVGVRLRITGDLRDEWHKLDRIEAAVRETAVLGHGEQILVLPDHASNENGGAPATAEPEPSLPERRRAVSQRGAVAVSAAAAVTLVLFVLGWWRAAHANGASSALTGFALAAVAGILLTAEFCLPALSLRRRLGRRKAELFGPGLARAQAVPAAAMPASSAAMVTAAGLTRFHRDGCPATAGLTVVRLDRDSATASLAPCELCAAG